MASEPIIDLSDPNIVHIIYPEGMTVPDHMMDPNLGGWHKKDNSTID